MTLLKGCTILKGGRAILGGNAGVDWDPTEVEKFPVRSHGRVRWSIVALGGDQGLGKKKQIVVAERRLEAGVVL